MFKTIFSKLMVTNLLITTSVVIAISLMFSLIYSLKVFDEKQKTLLSAAFKTNQLAVRYENGSIAKDELSDGLDNLGFVTDSKIYLVKLNKGDLGSMGGLALDSELKDGYILDDLAVILDGGTVLRKWQYSINLDSQVVFAGVPWKNGESVQGAILLFSPVNNIVTSIVRIIMTVLLTGLFFIILSAFYIYYNSKKISNPIKKMEQAAVLLAAGVNIEDMAVDSSDEVGKLAEAFNYMKRQLADTEKMRREFIANVSHDLRTPLTSINGLVEGMLEGIAKPEDYNKYLMIIYDETNRLNRLTDDILQMAKLQSGGLILKTGQLNVAEVLESVRESTSSLAGEKDISLDMKCDVSLQLVADKDRLIQVLVNLIGNSVKYGVQGGRILVSAEGMPSMVRFTVADNGIGIPEYELRFIFEKFYMVDKTRNTSQGSTGLGLNIAKIIVELHKGRIWAESEQGKGTKIIFEIPNVYNQFTN